MYSHKHLIESLYQGKSWETDDASLSGFLQEATFEVLVRLGAFPRFDGCVLYDCMKYNDIVLDEAKYDINTLIRRGGTAADLFLGKGKELFVATSKRYSSVKSIGDYDIEKIANIFTGASLQKKSYAEQGYNLSLIFVVKNKREFLEMVGRARTNNCAITSHIHCENIFDDKDLTDALEWAKIRYPTVEEAIEFLCEDRRVLPQLRLRLHQIIAIDRYFHTLGTDIILAQASRTGKSYVLAGIISRVGGNYCIITTRPTETYNQYLKIFAKYSEFKGYNIQYLKINQEKPVTKDRNIIICSKQFFNSANIGTKVKWLLNLKFETIFIDEADSGGVTAQANEVYQTYFLGVRRMYISATPEKIIRRYSLRYIIEWGRLDVVLCQNRNVEELARRHGERYRGLMTENELSGYDIFPRLHVITPAFFPSFKNEILKAEDNYGWSLASLLLHDGKRFLKEQKVRQFLEYSFGPSFTGKIRKPTLAGTISQRIESTIRDLDVSRPLIFALYLPVVKVSELSNILKELLNRMYPTDRVECANSDAKTLDIQRMVTESTGKHERIFLLLGKMFTRAVSIPQCDVVWCCNTMDGNSDEYKQMVPRCITEDIEKPAGLFIDCNSKRLFQYIVNLAKEATPNAKDVREAIKYILEQRLVHISCPLTEVFNLEHTVEKVYDGFTKSFLDEHQKVAGAITSILNDIDVFYIGRHEYRGRIEELTKSTTKQTRGVDTDIPDGIVKHRKDRTEDIPKEDIPKEDIPKEDIPKEDIPKEDRTDISMDIKKLIPVLALVSVRSPVSDFLGMLNYIKENGLKHVLAPKIKEIMFGKITSESDIDTHLSEIERVYNEKIRGIASFNGACELIKHLFQDSQSQGRLGVLVDEYLIPTDNEKKEMGEVSTPFKIRQEMLDILPKEFWMCKTQKVFEPCCGKGGFVVDLLSRFDIGLSMKIPDGKERKRWILENCLYFADLNPLNVFITELLIDPQKEYRLNKYVGDTLVIDTEKVFKISSFDLIVGNPPYATNPSKQDTKPLYHLFVEKYFTHSRLLMITPSRWFSGGKGLDKYRNMMLSRRDLSHLKHYDDARDVFPGVEIKGGVSWFLQDSQYQGDCWFESNNTLTPLTLSDYDILVDPKYLPLINAVKDLPNIQEIFMSASYYKVRPNDSRLTLIKNNPEDIQCYVSSLKATSRVKYIALSHLRMGLPDTWKVITAEASGKGRSGFGWMGTITPSDVYTDSYIGFRVQTPEEGLSLISYLKTPLINFLLGSRKISQHINTSVVKWIPLVPLDREWSDDAIFEYFKLPVELKGTY